MGKMSSQSVTPGGTDEEGDIHGLKEVKVIEKVKKASD